MSSLEKRLLVLAGCSSTQDLRARGQVVEAALDVTRPTPQFLSDLYDVCVASVTVAAAANGRTSDGGTELDGSNADALATPSSRSQMCATCAAAALRYLPGQDGRVVQQFLDAFFLPLLARRGALPDRACCLQACTGLAALLTSGRLFTQLRQVVDTCFTALQAAVGAPAHSAGRAGSTSCAGTALPLPVVCMLLPAAVHELCALQQQQPAAPTEEGMELLRYALTRLREALRAMLSNLSGPVRQAALKSIVPSALACAQTCGGADLAATAQDLWRLALELLGSAGDVASSEHGAAASASSAPAAPAASAAATAAPVPSSAACTPQQRTALALLVSCSGLLQDPATGVDVQGCGRFWELLRACLALPADVDSLERKRALLLLQRLAPAGQMGRPGWTLWTALYDILDEFPIHLVAPMWAKIDQLHAPAPEYRTEAVVPKSYIPRKKELKQRKAAAANTTSTTAAADGDGDAASTDAGGAGAAAGGGADAWCVPMEWQVVLWGRALQHGNFQVQRLAMRTLLQRDWRAAEALRGVPPGFVAAVLLPALTRDHHYRGGAAEADVLDVQAVAASWLRAWFAAAPVAARVEGLLALRGVVVGSDLSRLGLQQLMRCVAAGAAGAAADGQLAAAAASGGGAASAAAAGFPGAMLVVLRAVLVYLANFTGIPFKRVVWQSVLATAAAVAPTAVAGVGACLRLLSELPPGTLEPGGELREMARSWQLGRSTPQSDTTSTAATVLASSEAAAVATWLRGMLDEYWTQGVASPAAVITAATPTEATAGAAAAPAAATAQAIAQLLLLFDDVDAAAAAVVQRLQQALYGMYGRPYLQAAEVDRALGLLRELLAAVPPLPLPLASGDAPAASALQSGLLGLLVNVTEDLCSVASHAADAFLEASGDGTAASLARADDAWACVSRALVRASRSPDAATAPAVRRLAATLLSLLGRLGTAPLPAGRPAAVVTGLRAATAAAEALRQSSAWSSQVRDMASERLDPSALPAAALRDAAATAPSPGSNGARDVSSVVAEVEAVKWPLLDAATACAAELPPPRAGARGTAAAGAAGSSAGAAAAGLRLQPGVLCDVMAQSVGALSEYPEGQVLPLLRCLRRCWVAVAMGGAELQAAAARAVGSDAGECERPPLASLCWAVVRALWNALCATPRRTGPLCAAFVNTALLPCLYVQQDGAMLSALHGPDGPCRWLLSRLLEWGGTSSRFLLLLACQLGSFLPLRPELLGCYGREVQGLLLWGSRKGSTYDPDAADNTEGPAAEELAAVATPLDPALVSSATVGSEVAPRVALLCCLHRMAQLADCVWPPPAESVAAAASANAATAAAERQAAEAGPSSTAQAADAEAGAVPKRPVIIFGDSSLWDESNAGTASSSTSAPNAPASSSRAAGTDAANGKRDGTSAATPTGADNAAAGEADADYGAPPPPDPEHPALLAGRALWRQLLHVALTDPLLSTDKVRNGSELHRQKVRLWQSLVVLSSFAPREECGSAVSAALVHINGNNPPTVKQYIEAVVAALVLREPSLLHSQLLPLLSSYGRHISGLGSYILIASQVLLHSPPAVQRTALRPLLLALCPWLMCHGHNVRTYAQLVMWSLLHRFPPEDPMWAHSIGDLGYLRQMLAFMRTNVDLVRLRKNIGDPILEWSPAGMAHPARVFASGAEGVCLAGSPHEQATFEGAPPTLVDRIQVFLVSERHRLRDELADRAAEREFAPQDPNGPVGRATHGSAAAADVPTTAAPGAGGAAGAGSSGRGPAAEGAAGAAGGGGGIGDFQRKITPEALLAALEGPAAAAARAAGGDGGGGGGAEGAVGGLAALLEAEEEEAQDWKASSGSRRHRHDVLLVASLIDKLPNLAGLARTCEVLGAGRMVLADLEAAKDPVFTSVSVTAEQWLPMEEVKPAALLAWLEQRAAEGYTLVGLEQTAESVRLPDYRWPDKVVLVLGREKEGIPPEVLSLLDVTLEIPQRGIIRSLNVHVSGAIALYEYVRQMQA